MKKSNSTLGWNDTKRTLNIVEDAELERRIRTGEIPEPVIRGGQRRFRMSDIQAGKTTRRPKNWDVRA